MEQVHSDHSLNSLWQECLASSSHTNFVYMYNFPFSTDFTDQQPDDFVHLEGYGKAIGQLADIPSGNR